MSGDDPDPDPGTVTDQRLQQAQATRAAMDTLDSVVTGDLDFEPPSVRDDPLRIGVGLLAVLAGLAAAVGLGVPVVPRFEVVIAGTATLALLAGAALLTRRLFAPVHTAETADVEYRTSVTVPGSDFDAALREAVGGRGTARYKARKAVDERVRAAATAVTAHTDELTDQAARQRVADGSWTDDPAAAAALSGEAAASSLRDQVRTLAGDRSELASQVDRVLAELAAMAPGVSFGTETSEPGTGPATTDTTGGERRQVDRRTERWTGVTGLGLLAVGLGLWGRQADVPPSLVVATAVVVGAAGYVYLSSPPSLSLSVDREFAPTDPAPGDRVTVTVTLENDGKDVLPDLRVVDGVAPALRVVEGSPRFATALRPGERLSFSYVVEAVRGDHPFDPVHVIARDFSGALERERHVAADSGAVLAADSEARTGEQLPVHPHTARRVGRVVTDTGGSGVELHSVREYRRGDPLSRIDWNRYARTGELSTVEFRQERAAAVVLLVDARQTAYVAPDREHRNAVERSVDAAAQVFASLLDAGDRVGIAALSPRECWLAPGAGRDHRNRGRELLASHPALAPTPPEQSYLSSSAIRRLRRRLPADAQVLFFSPLIDERAVEVARGLDARGHAVTVVSPDATATDTVGRRLARLERRNRLTRLRRAGLRVVDWGAEPLGARVARAERRWSG